MSEFVKRQPLSEEAREKSHAYLISSGAVDILTAMNSVMPGSTLSFKDTIMIPHGDSLAPGYILTGRMVPSKMRVEMRRRSTTSRRTIPPIDRDVLSQPALYVTTSKNSLVLSGTRVDTFRDPMKALHVGGGIAIYKPTVLANGTIPIRVLSWVSKYLERLDMINPDQQKNAYELLMKQNPKLF